MIKNILKFMFLMLFICVNIIGIEKIFDTGNGILMALASLFTSIFILFTFVLAILIYQNDRK